MSTGLVWFPIIPQEPDHLVHELKYVMQKKYGSFIDVVLTNTDIDYLIGLRDAGLGDADKLIEGIKQYGKIQVREI